MDGEAGWWTTSGNIGLPPLARVMGVSRQQHLCVTAQYPTFQEVEQQIEEALEELTHYYRSNSLRANPDKTQVTAFHLRNREANRSLQVSWNGVDLENTDTPKYLGVTLDRTLSYKTHIHNTKMKVATRKTYYSKEQRKKCLGVIA